MMMQFIQGQKQKIGDLLTITEKFSFEVQLASSLTIDVALFGLDSESRLSDEAYMIFYNQPQSPCGAVKLMQNTATHTTFDIELQKLNPKIERLVVTLAIDNSTQGVMSALQSSVLTIKNANASVVASFNFDGKLFAQEKAIMLFEAYKKDNVWRFNAIAQGFNGGLDKLIEYFGGEVASDNNKAEVIPPPTVNLNKVTLTKNNSTISLRKKHDFGKISINLNWNRDKLKKAFSAQVDLDLGAFIELKDGNKTCIQAVGGNFGSYESYPYCYLRDDDRSGHSDDGEWIDINGDNWQKISRVLIYAFIYSGVPNWQETDGVVNVYLSEQPPIETHLTEGAGNLGMCAIVELVNDNGDVKINRINQYFNSHQEMDRAFNWGFSWIRGSK